ncbi:MAG: glycosyl hydrolase family 18 protein [Mucilaginibacter sp.]
MAIPTPYAGSYYPIYNSGLNQYIPPTTSMPFQQISALFLAFAHAYPVGTNGAHSALQLEQGQPDEPQRVPLVVSTARSVNPGILAFISLGWGHDDWTYISNDYNTFLKGKGLFNFPGSVVSLIRQYQLDGFDIDDESLNDSSGTISQADFTAVCLAIKTALVSAGKEDGKTYYFSVTPAGTPGSALLNDNNIGVFDLINTQNYGGSNYAQYAGFKRTSKACFAYGVNSEGGHEQVLTPAMVAGMAGAFNWSLSADSNYNYQCTANIASVTGYDVS